MPATTLTVDQKLARVRQTYDKLTRGDYEGAAEEFTDNAAWHGFLVGDIKGKAAIKGAFEKLKQLNPTWQLHDALANDEHVVALHEIRVTAGGKTAQARQAMVTHMSPDGKIEEMWTMGNPQDLAAVMSARP